LKLTQKELAEKLNVAPNNVFRWESGRAMPRFSALRKMSTLFGCKIEDLVSEEQVNDAAENQTNEGAVMLNVYIEDPLETAPYEPEREFTVKIRWHGGKVHNVEFSGSIGIGATREAIGKLARDFERSVGDVIEKLEG
jgi:transcriptional regulator with XRE-family HTH domain